MARVTVIKDGRSMRVCLPVAEQMVRNGAKIDADDRRGKAQWERHVASRPGLLGAFDYGTQSGMPSGWTIVDSNPPWFTVYDKEGEKVGKSQKSREAALRLAMDEAAHREGEV